MQHDKIFFERLKHPFPSRDIEWRIQQSGLKNDKPWAKILAYVTARAIQERLDDIAGPENWKNEFTQGPQGGVLCGLSIRVGEEWVTKWDGAENTDVEGVKGGLSGSLKRAAVQWGIGRYLYDLGESWAAFRENGQYKAKLENRWFSWDPPRLPDWALPENERQDAAAIAGRSYELAPDELSRRFNRYRNRIEQAAGREELVAVYEELVADSHLAPRLQELTALCSRRKAELGGAAARQTEHQPESGQQELELESFTPAIQKRYLNIRDELQSCRKSEEVDELFRAREKSIRSLPLELKRELHRSGVLIKRSLQEHQAA